MHPILFTWKVPLSWLPYGGQASWLFANWRLFAVLFAISFAAYLWATSPDRKTPQPIVAWGGGLASLAFGGVLGFLGVIYLGKLELHTYGVLISIAFLFGIMLSTREARRTGEDPDRILDLAFWILISSIVGSRLLFIVTTWEEYWRDLAQAPIWYQSRLFRIWEGGLVFHGGLIGALLATWWFVRRYKMNFLKIADIVVPTVALGQFFGRLGCFSAGCCHGKATDVSWGVVFQDGLALKGIAVHPTQLYEACACLLIYAAILYVRSEKRYHGAGLLTYLFLYPIARFVIEMYRGDDSRGYLFFYDLLKDSKGFELLTWGQMISILLFALGIGLWLWLRSQANLSLAPSASASPAPARR